MSFDRFWLDERRQLSADELRNLYQQQPMAPPEGVPERLIWDSKVGAYVERKRPLVVTKRPTVRRP